jgi:hypothetical protein
MLRELENHKQEVLMLRREIAKSSRADNKLKHIQKKLHDKMVSAQERKEIILAAKKAKASEHLISSSDRNMEVLELNEMKEVQTKAKVEQRLESAERRRTKLAQIDQEKREKRKERQLKALEIAKQRQVERDAIASWEEASLPTLLEVEEDLVEETEISENYCSDVLQQDGRSGSDSDSGDLTPTSYEEKRLKAKHQLMEEIRLANMAKLKEMEHLAKQVKKPGKMMQRDISVSAESFGTLDSYEVLSFDEQEADASIISGLSTIREHEKKKIENKKAQAVLALAELDIKLSEIQLMQAILLAEEASLSGKAEFKTSDQSVEDLNRINVNKKMFAKEQNNKLLSSENQKQNLKNIAKSFLSHTFHQAKVAKEKAGKTLVELKSKIEKTEMERKKKRIN